MSEIPDIVDFLRELPGFDALDDTLLGKCARNIEIAYYRKGDDILAVGTENRSLHIVRTGAVELRNEEEEMMARLAEGDCFGFPSLMNNTPARQHSVALEDTLIYHLGGEAFAEARQKNSEFDTFFIRSLSDRLTTKPPPTTFRGAAGQTALSLVRRGPVSIGPDATIREAAEKMVAERVSSILVSDGRGMRGIITDRDFRARVVAPGLSFDGPVTDVMSRDPISIDGSVHAYEAAMVMMQNNIHHLPITDDVELVGMVSRSDFMRFETEHPFYLVSDIGKQTTVEGIVALSKRIPALIIGQMESDATGEQLGKFITTITDAITRQCLKIAEAQLGSPPCDYAWVALGSQGRLEQSGKSDQDNALLLSDSVPADADEYFAAMAKIVNDGLNDCGYVYCPGEVMAVNPKWRQPLAVWKRYFHRWITVPEEKALMHANIFFDLRCVSGSRKLVD